MARPDLLMIAPMMPMVSDQLAPHFEIHRLWQVGDRDAFLAETGPRIRAAALQVGAPFPTELMARLPALEIISNFGVGYDSVDAAWAGRHGIVVTNTPDVLNEEVADLAIGLLIATLRELPQADRYLRAGQWPQAPYPLTRGTLRGRSVGILGLGRIGRAIAARLEPFGVRLCYHGRRPQPDVPYSYFGDLVAMAAAVDALIVMAPATPETRNIVDARVLAALGSEGVLINMARGSLVDEPALIEALRDGTIRAAGLDVYADEPRVPAALIALDNTVLLPHVASASQHTRGLMAQLTIDNLTAWLAGRPPLTPVPETPWPEVRAARAG